MKQRPGLCSPGHGLRPSGGPPKAHRHPSEYVSRDVGLRRSEDSFCVGVRDGSRHSLMGVYLLQRDGGREGDGVEGERSKERATEGKRQMGGKGQIQEGGVSSEGEREGAVPDCVDLWLC